MSEDVNGTNGTELKELGELGAELKDLEVKKSSEIRAAASVILDRMAFLNRAGITFKGKRDLYEVLGYSRLITFREYRDRYMRGGIAARIVDAMPNATWRGEMEIVEDEDPKISTPFEKAWSDLSRKHQILAKLARVDKLAGLSTYSVLLIGAGGNLTDELPPAGGNPDRLLYLSAFSGGGGPGGDSRSRSMAVDADCSIETFDTNVESPRFGMPTQYRLKRTDLSSPELQRPVHWTRIVHVAENCLFDEVYGQPTLERCWNLLDDLDKVTGGGAEAFWLRANAGMQLDIDKDMQLPNVKDAVASLKDQSEEYKHQLTRIIRTRGVKIQQLGSDTANFAGPADAVLKQIAGAMSMPLRILTGSEMGELASSQDRDNWKDQIDGRQKGHAAPYIVRPLVDRLIKFGYLPKPKEDPSKPLAYEVRWPHIQTLTEQEKADGAAKWATINSTFGAPIFTQEEIRDKWYQMEPLEEGDSATDELTELDKATGVTKWGMVNKEMGLTIFTPAEMRRYWYGFDPLSPEEEKPISAPEKVQGTAPDGTPIEGTPVVQPPVDEPLALQETLRLLETAIEENDGELIDEILGITR